MFDGPWIMRRSATPTRAPITARRTKIMSSVVRHVKRTQCKYVVAFVMLSFRFGLNRIDPFATPEHLTEMAPR